MSADATASRTAVADAAIAATRAASTPTTREERAGWLDALAAALDDDRAELVRIAHEETHLSSPRLDGEITRMAVAGRLLFDGWPTGVAIGRAQHHGGGWPSTTASIHTSVGATALRRWLTPIAYQDAPQAVLPPELRDGNPLRIPRRDS